MADCLFVNAEKHDPFFMKMNSVKDQMIFFRKSYRQGSLLCSKGEFFQAAFIVIKGSIRVAKKGRNGRDITLYRVGAGQACMLSISSLLSKSPYPAIASAEIDTEVVLLSLQQLKKLMKEDIDFQNNIFQLLSDKLFNFLSMVDRKLDERIIEILLISEKDEVEVTHDELANELGTAREVISRVMKGFEKEGLLRIRRGKIIIIDRIKLEQKLNLE